MRKNRLAVRGGLVLVVALSLAVPEPATAQSFFERLFRPAQPAPPPQPIPRTQPQPQAPAQPRRTAPQQGTSQPASPQGQQQAAPQPQPEPPPAPYEPDLLRLAEILGSMAFLRSLCSQQDAAEWPRRMQSLLDAEGTTSGRRERLAGAYNRGYRAYGLTYRSCTPSANEATSRYLKEGEQLARTLTTRYGS